MSSCTLASDERNQTIRLVILAILYLACGNQLEMLSVPLKIDLYPFIGLILSYNNDDNAEFNLRVDHGLHESVRDWLLDSTAPVFVNEC